MSLEPESQQMNPATVADYLRQHPRFLEEHPEVLADLALSLGAGGTVSSLLERQVLTLREKVKLMDQRQSLMLHHAHENEVIQDKLMRLVRELLLAKDLGERAQVLVEQLKTLFALDLVELIEWNTKHPQADTLGALIGPHRPSCWSARSDQGSAVVACLTHPHEGLGSLALLPLKPTGPDQASRAVVLGAHDSSRFEPGQGMVFLERMAELASAALHAQSG
ncbi:MAG: hypothetical protein RLZZ290_86 [Pseudomonadota bacterium]|jgi:uncharacterized protein